MATHHGHGVDALARELVRDRLRRSRRSRVDDGLAKVNVLEQIRDDVAVRAQRTREFTIPASQWDAPCTYSFISFACALGPPKPPICGLGLAPGPVLTAT